MNTVAALLLTATVVAAQEPPRPLAVVVLPVAIRDSMSAKWSETNRGWDDASDRDAFMPMRPIATPTRAYLGCLTGILSGDTLWVQHLVLKSSLVTQAMPPPTRSLKPIAQSRAQWRRNRSKSEGLDLGGGARFISSTDRNFCTGMISPRPSS
jgi:hypothetical protein